MSGTLPPLVHDRVHSIAVVSLVFPSCPLPPPAAHCPSHSWGDWSHPVGSPRQAIQDPVPGPPAPCPIIPKAAPCPAPQRPALRFCATALPKARARSVCPPHTCGLSSSLKPLPPSQMLSLSFWLDTAGLLSSVPLLKTRGSSQVPRLSWSRQDPGLQVQDLCMVRESRCLPKTVGPASNGQQDHRPALEQCGPTGCHPVTEWCWPLSW